jgi:hypothetical protein
MENPICRIWNTISLQHYLPSSNRWENERVNRVLEDMLRMHVMHQPKKWEDYLPLVEFSYNNGYQESLKMSPFEALYGRKCRIPISWDNLVDRITLGPEMLKEMEQEVVRIKKNMKVAQDRKKSYVDKKELIKSSRWGIMCISGLILRGSP